MKLTDVTCAACGAFIGTICIADGITLSARCKCGAPVVVAAQDAAANANSDRVGSDIGFNAVDVVVADTTTNNATKAHRLRAIASRWIGMQVRLTAHLARLADEAAKAASSFEEKAEQDAAHQAVIQKRQTTPPVKSEEAGFQELCIAMSFLNPGCLDGILGIEKFDPSRLIGAGLMLSNDLYRAEAKRRLAALK